jgi:serine/threonine protein kinase/lipoprotein NlpI
MASVTPAPPWVVIDQFVERYEAAQARARDTNLVHFLPPVSHPLYRQVLRELVRVDLEYGWSRGQPRSLESYRRDFPELFRDPEALAEIAFEEYRQRRERGDNPSTAEYELLFGVNTAGWAADGPRPSAAPAPAAGQGLRLDQGVSPRAEDGPAAGEGGSDDGLMGAARAYQHFRLHHAPEDSQALDLLCSSFHVGEEAADVFREVHRADPDAASRLAQATTAMPEVGQEFLGFRLISELGRGAFGRVFYAEQGDLANRPVALKIATHLSGEPQTLAQLQHTNIVPIFSVHQAGPLQAVCMPYLGATTLADVCKDLQSTKTFPTSGKHLVSTLNERRNNTCWRTASTVVPRACPTVADPGQPPPAAPEPAPAPAGTVILDKLEGFSYVEAVLWLAARLASGLAHAHERGIFHRDLKPANILLTDEGQPMLLDFNLSEDVKLRATAAAACVGGTFPYMSPEHIEAFQGGKRPIDGRSDIYSLGLILFELLTGRSALPHRPGRPEKILPRMIADRRQPPPRLRCWNRCVSPAVESIVRHCLEPEPDHRYPSARELQEDIERHLADLPLKYAPEPSLRERAGKAASRHLLLLSVAAIGLLAIGLILLLPSVYATRQHRYRQLEALQNLTGFREDVKLARFLLNKVAPARKDLDEGGGLCRRALERFGVLDNPAWLQLPGVRNLPAGEDPDALRQEVGELLLVWARALALQAEQDAPSDGRQQRVQLGLRLTALAEEQFAGGQPSKALALERAELTRLLGREDEARELRARADALKPQGARDLFLTALRHSDRREFQQALPLLSEATRLQPQYVWPWFYQGFCHQELGQDLEAIRCYTACIALAPRLSNSYLPYFNRGLAYVRQRRFPEACADFDQAISLRPGAAEAFINRGIARTEAGQYAAAIEDLSHALELDPSLTRVYFLRATARERAGDRAGADQDRAAGRREEPTDELSWIDRGRARVDSDPEGALADFDKALELNPRALPALQNKAHVLAEKLHRPEAAVRALDQAIALYPGFVPSRVGRGVVLARLGRRREAHDDARESLARDSKPQTFYQAANIYALTSRQNPEDRFQAFPLLSIALRGGFGLDILDHDPDMDPIRDDPEFIRLVRAARALRGPANPTP